MRKEHTIGTHGDLVRRVHRGKRIVVQVFDDKGQWRDMPEGNVPDDQYDESRAIAIRLQRKLEKAQTTEDNRTLL